MVYFCSKMAEKSAGFALYSEMSLSRALKTSMFLGLMLVISRLISKANCYNTLNYYSLKKIVLR